MLLHGAFRGFAGGAHPSPVPHAASMTSAARKRRSTGQRGTATRSAAKNRKPWTTWLKLYQSASIWLWRGPTSPHKAIVPQVQIGGRPSAKRMRTATTSTSASGAAIRVRSGLIATVLKRRRILAKHVAFAQPRAMLRVFGPHCTPAPLDSSALQGLPEGVIWIDLLEPTREEEILAEKFVGFQIPTREELSEIEPSSRLYQRNGAAVMTMSVLHGISDGQPGSEAIGFILTDRHLVTVRYTDPKSFVIFAEHFYADPELATDARSVLVRLLDAIVDRLADEFQAAGAETESISRQIFNHHTVISAQQGAPSDWVPIEPVPAKQS